MPALIFFLNSRRQRNDGYARLSSMPIWCLWQPGPVPFRPKRICQSAIYQNFYYKLYKYNPLKIHNSTRFYIFRSEIREWRISSRSYFGRSAFPYNSLNSLLGNSPASTIDCVISRCMMSSLSSATISTECLRRMLSFKDGAQTRRYPGLFSVDGWRPFHFMTGLISELQIQIAQVLDTKKEKICTCEGTTKKLI